MVPVPDRTAQARAAIVLIMLTSRPKYAVIPARVIVQRDRDWNDGAARKRFLQLLEAQGLEDEWARGQRRRLSALLFT